MKQQTNIKISDSKFKMEQSRYHSQGLLEGNVIVSRKEMLKLLCKTANKHSKA